MRLMVIPMFMTILLTALNSLATADLDKIKTDAEVKKTLYQAKIDATNKSYGEFKEKAEQTKVSIAHANADYTIADADAGKPRWWKFWHKPTAEDSEKLLDAKNNLADEKRSLSDFNQKAEDEKKKRDDYKKALGEVDKNAKTDLDKRETMRGEFLIALRDATLGTKMADIKSDINDAETKIELLKHTFDQGLIGQYMAERMVSFMNSKAYCDSVANCGKPGDSRKTFKVDDLKSEVFEFLDMGQNGKPAKKSTK